MLGRQQEQECFKCSAAFEEIQLKTKFTILWPESGFVKGDFILIHFDIQDFRCISCCSSANTLHRTNPLRMTSER